MIIIFYENSLDLVCKFYGNIKSLVLFIMVCLKISYWNKNFILNIVIILY